MAVAWALNKWGTNSWLGMNGGPPNAWRGGVSPVPPVTTPDIGGKGDNERRRLRLPVKPTGLLERREIPAGRKTVDERTDQAAQIQAEIAARLARELGEEAESALFAIEEMSQAQVAAEISARLRKKLQDEEDLVLMMAMIAALS